MKKNLMIAVLLLGSAFLSKASFAAHGNEMEQKIAKGQRNPITGKGNIKPGAKPTTAAKGQSK